MQGQRERRHQLCPVSIVFPQQDVVRAEGSVRKKGEAYGLRDES